MNNENSLPESWVACVLGDVVDYGIGERFEPFEIPDDAWVLELEDIEKGSSKLLQRVTMAERPAKSTKTRFNIGDVLYGKLRPYLDKVLIADQSGYCTTEIIPISPTDAVYGKYLFYALKRPEFVEYATSASHGLNMPRLGTQAARIAPFRLAPLKEQRRVVEKLDAIFSRIDKARRRLGLVPIVLERFRNAVIAAATSGRLTQDWRASRGFQPGYKSFDSGEDGSFRSYVIPNAWDISRLGDVASIVGGLTKDAKKQLPDYEEVPYLRVANVQRGHLDLSELKTIRVPRQRIDYLLLQPGDILFNEGGDRDKLGRGWIWEGQIERCTFQNHVFRARLDNPEFAGEFFSWFGNTRAFDFFLSHGKQSTNLASINKRVLESLPVPIPNAEEQSEIVSRVRTLFDIADRLDAQLARAVAEMERVGPASLDKAFQGELVPQDPTDEPARVLLGRFRMARNKRTGDPKRPTQRRKREKPSYMTTLREALAANSGWITAEEAFRRCGWVVADTDRVEQLYSELRELLRNGGVESEVVRDEQGRKLTERLRLATGDDHAAR